MSRSDRGKGPRPLLRTPLQRLLLGRGRPETRMRMLLAGAFALLLVGVALIPGADLHAPVLQAVQADAPDRTEYLATLVEERFEPRFEPVEDVVVGLHPDRLRSVTEAVRAEVRRGSFPGAALVMGRGDRVVEKVGMGSVAPGGDPVDPDGTLYDLASLTKVLATTAAIMLLVEDGVLDLDDPVSRYLPGFSGGAKARVTMRQLLTHTSGLPAGVVLRTSSPEAALERLTALPLRREPGAQAEYSDVGPILAFAAAERAAGEDLAELLRRRVYEPLGMRQTGFVPSERCACAPTTRTIRGSVHDPLAQRLGGRAGHAGLFATATDVARFAAMLAGGGELEGVRIFSEETIAEFTRRQAGAGTRAIGWDTRDPRGRGPGGTRVSDTSFGHTGFTGTSLWVDPERGTWAVLLSNRTYTRGPNRMQALRRTIHDRLAMAADQGGDPAGGRSAGRRTE